MAARIVKKMKSDAFTNISGYSGWRMINAIIFEIEKKEKNPTEWMQPLSMNLNIYCIKIIIMMGAHSNKCAIRCIKYTINTIFA